MLEPRSNFSVAILNGRLVVMGGYRQDFKKSRNIVIIMVKMNLAGRRPGRWRAVCATWWTSTAPPPTSSSQSFHLDKMRRWQDIKQTLNQGGAVVLSW